LTVRAAKRGISDMVCAGLADLAFDDLPSATVTAAKHVLLDAVGVMLAATGMAEEPRPFLELAGSTGAGPCAILGTGVRTAAPMAALANGALAHALDYEDAFDLAPGHPNASLVPALIALTQSEAPVDGRRLLTALAAGCELSCRIALALRQEMEAGGWYPPPIVAGFGAAAGAAKLLGLDARGIRDALSLMLCQVTMPGEIKHSRDTVIRAVREAFPAQAAVQSALLARGGVPGFEAPLEGEAGFYALYAGGAFDPALLTEELGERFWIERLTFKPWPSCRGTHPFIEMALRLREQGVDPMAIASTAVGIDDVQAMLVEPLARKQAPAVAIDAKFSIPFCTALALTRGRVALDDFTPANLCDPAILALAAKVIPRRHEAPAWQRGSGGRMEIALADGGTLAAEVDNALGCPERPLGETALVAKFVDCARRAARPLAEADAHALAEHILSIDDCPDAGALLR
jgi:2-methylcitrate dehydratase PrpD